MPEIKPEALREVKSAFERYEAQVEASNIFQLTKLTYIRYAKNFVHWLEGDFTPGGTGEPGVPTSVGDVSTSKTVSIPVCSQCGKPKFPGIPCDHIGA